MKTTHDYYPADTFADAVRRRWDAAVRGPLRGLLPAAAPVAVAADLVRADQVEGWRRGAAPPLEAYFAEFPELRADRDAFLLVAGGELSLRGNAAALADLRRRFPDRAADLDRLWEVFSALGTDSPTTGVPGYTIEQQVRRFAWGADHEAVQLGLRRRVLLRRIDPAPGAEVGPFLAYARHVSKLDHPDLLPVYDAGRAGPAVFAAVQLLPGVTLAERLADGPLLPRDAARVAAAVGRAVAYVVARGLLVRALSPENVILTGSGCRYLSLPLELVAGGGAERSEPVALLARLYALAVGRDGTTGHLPAACARALRAVAGAPSLARLAAAFDRLATGDDSATG